MVKLAFHDNCLCERGTTISVYDYAYYNKYYLGNESIIMYIGNDNRNVPEVIEKFKKEFKLCPYNDWNKEADNILLNNKCDILYMQKAGCWDGKISSVCKNIIHCVFNTNYIHGDVYGKISNSFGKEAPVVNYMVNLPNINTNMRKKLNIPDDAFVLGRHGGNTQFDIEYVHSVINEIANNNQNIYFLFVNTNKFCIECKNIIHLDKIIDLNEKTEFINSCDVMIHARKMGETFGASISEFSIRNKPIITSKMGDIAHINILKDKCFIYHDDISLRNIILQLYNTKNTLKNNDWNMYKFYTPHNIMDEFNEKFIKPCIKTKICFNGFYSGFFDKKNPGTTITFFIKFFEKIYNSTIIISDSVDSDILCEFDMLIDSHSLVNTKKWKHTYLFNGEYKCLCDKAKYDCVLFAEKNNNNIINLPIYISYIESNNIIFNKIKRIEVPKKDICVIISNGDSKNRNYIINKLDKHFNIDYLGSYKNNIGGALKAPYNSEEFKKYISQYKFIISIENNRQETYITEKIILGLSAQIIPIYWGSKYIYNYFNKDRILALLQDDNYELDKEIDILINKINHIKNNEELWLNIVNRPIYPLDIGNNEKIFRNIEDVVYDVKNLLKIDKKNYYNKLSKIYCITDKKFEENNYNLMEDNFKNKLNLSKNYIKYICPTYKSTITDELYNKYAKSTDNTFLNRKIKRSELSLIINYKTILQDIINNYNDGLFFIFESDIYLNKDIDKLNNFIEYISDIKGWDFIHLGEHSDNILYKPSIELFKKFNNNERYIEDITDFNSEFRIIRKLHTRCVDSILWNYKGILNFLNYMNINDNYNIPLDYYIIKYLETNNDVKHYWSVNNFFINGSNNNLIKSNIQNDNN
tara:strand:- start:2879 stop:5482 length:2604 start_codon:yes stop_codon:yes gene_type:complete